MIGNCLAGLLRDEIRDVAVQDLVVPERNQHGPNGIVVGEPADLFDFVELRNLLSRWLAANHDCESVLKLAQFTLR
ncbi:hypothetical protein D3C72_2348770 [compost metagenome]